MMFMGFKKFIVVWLLLLVGGTLLVWNVATFLNSSRVSEVSEGHFSVRWMGFVPDYNSKYPDYYICVNNLKDNLLKMDIALQIKNQEDRDFYFTVEKYTEPPAGWTLPTMYVGLIRKDETKNFAYTAYRTKPASVPAGRLTETITIVVKAYYDASYTNLYSQDNFSVTFHFIDRTSSVWTILYNDNFDDGTTQGWGSVGSGSSVSVSSSYYRSYRYSLQLYSTTTADCGYVKNFNIPTIYKEAYLIFSIRSHRWPATAMRILYDGVVYFMPDIDPSTRTWYQFTVPLPTEPPEVTKVEIYAIRGAYADSYAYLDDVYVIAKP